jgi:Cu-processing system ATP-binding protein
VTALPHSVTRGALALVPSQGTPVRVDQLAKSFGRLTVLEQVNTTFQPGRITALIGPNAAGKTTLLKCILGLVRPDAGLIHVGDEIVDTRADYRHAIGYMPQAPSFPGHLSAREVTKMLIDLRGPGTALDDELITRFQLRASFDKPVRTLSGGTRQKLNAALAFLFRPRVLILDEPTAGLDPIAAGILKEKVRAVRDDGATVIVTSHVIAELEELADDVVLLLDGAVRYEGTLGHIAVEAGEPRLERAIAALMLAGRPRP